MDKVTIYGVFEFVGFHFCNRFLENGCSVKGIHTNLGSSHCLEEKQLEVGRNANFEEVGLEQLEKTVGELQVMIVSLYDLYMTYQETKWNQTAFWKKIFHILNNRYEQIVFLLPIQFLQDSKETDHFFELKDLLARTTMGASAIQFFYLPTIFGPWQPSSFLFQRSMLPKHKDNSDPFIVREWIWDAIYVDDALNVIMKIIEKGENGDYIIESGVKNSWGTCADLLNIDQSILNAGENPLKCTEYEIKRVPEGEITPYPEALARQRGHLERLLDFDQLI